ATYPGAPQMAGLRPSLSFVVSGGGSAATDLGCRPSSPAAPARVSPPRKRRRVQPSGCWARMGTSSLADARPERAWARVERGSAAVSTPIEDGEGKKDDKPEGPAWQCGLPRAVTALVGDTRHLPPSSGPLCPRQSSAAAWS